MIIGMAMAEAGNDGRRRRSSTRPDEISRDSDGPAKKPDQLIAR